ncbi:MAG: phosphoesterase [Candidatus Pacearchaeota archaeon]|nr:MAG: phosphoesterase [Candidatus Pacearchaeota archaeon]
MNEKIKKEKNQEIFNNFEFVDKALFFPKKEILVIGDLHIGYDRMLEDLGVYFPKSLAKETISNLKKIFKKIKSEGKNIKKIVFLGDIKHAFYFERKERDDFLDVYEFLKKYFKEENIILIRGNHDTIDYLGGKIKAIHIEEEIAFLHGHKIYNEIFSKKIKYVVLAHLHPSIILKDKVKTEEYKCFLVGNYKEKTFIILPSFLEIFEGTSVNEYKYGYDENFSIIPHKKILDFYVYVIGEDKTYFFGKIKDLI